MRYIGQGWEIPIALSSEQAEKPDAATVQALFEADYEALFGRTVVGLDTEITVWAANATTDVPPTESVPPPQDAKLAPSVGQRRIFDPTSGKMSNAQLVDRNQLQDGDRISGPVAITEAETTIIVPTGFCATHRADGCIDIMRTRKENVQ